MRRGSPVTSLPAALALVALHLGAPVRAAAGSPAAPLPAVLPVRVNEVEAGEMTVLFDGLDALVRVADLVSAGLQGFAGSRRLVVGEEFVSLASLSPGVTWRLEETSLRLGLTAAPALLPRARRDLSRGRPAGILYTRDASAFLNYSLTLDDRGHAGVFTEAGWSAGQALLYSSASRRADGTLTRGLTNLTFDNRARLVRLVAGDSFATGGNLGGGVFLAGLSLSRSFALDPYFYRYPGVGVSGAVLTPTRADVYVNDRLVRQETLAPGTFDFSNLPIQNGSGETRVVLRDAFGGERALASPYFLSTTLLAKGLSDFSYGVGFRRRDQGGESFRYGDLVFVGRHQLGLSDRLTAGLRAEATPGLVSGGMAAAASFYPGEVEVALAASGGHGAGGLAASIRTSINLPGLNLGGYAKLTGDRYSTVSLPARQDRALVDAGGFAAVALGRLGSVTVHYAAQRWRDSGSAHRLSAAYTTHLAGGLSLALSASRGRTPLGGGTTEVFAGFHASLGARTSAIVSLGHDRGRGSVSAGLELSSPLGEGFGYSVRGAAQEGSAGSASVDAHYRGAAGTYDASYRRTGGAGTAYATVSGGLVAIGGAFFASRPVQQGFALIRVPGVAGIEGFSRNQETGRTNSDGDLLVPDLLPHYGNLIGISDTDIPGDYLVEAVQRVVAPPFRGGSIVTFPVRRLRAFTGRVSVSFRGTVVVPAYGMLSVLEGSEEHQSPIGSQGAFYLEDVSPGRRPAAIHFLGETCELVLVLPETGEPVTRLGDLVCRTDLQVPRGGAPVPPPAPAATPQAKAPSRATVTPATAQIPVPRALPGPQVHGVHISSYRERGKAEAEAARLARRLGAVGRAVEVDLGEKGVWYRVILGRFDNAAEARSFRARIAPRLGQAVGPVYPMGGRSS